MCEVTRWAVERIFSRNSIKNFHKNCNPNKLRQLLAFDNLWRDTLWNKKVSKKLCWENLFKKLYKIFATRIAIQTSCGSCSFLPLPISVHAHVDMIGFLSKLSLEYVIWYHQDTKNVINPWSGLEVWVLLTLVEFLSIALKLITYLKKKKKNLLLNQTRNFAQS